MFTRAIARLRAALGCSTLVVEVEKRSDPKLDAELRESVRSLAWHPGFRYLRDKLTFQRQALLARLAQSKHASLSDAEFIQSGIAWASWLEAQLDKATASATRHATPTTPSEEDLIEQVKASIERVGT